MSENVVRLVVSNKPTPPEAPKPIRFLCRIGWHAWGPWYQSPHWSYVNMPARTCTCCKLTKESLWS